MSGLLPCPFCGNPNPEIRHNNIGDSFVICHTDVEGEMCCGASSSECGCETDAGAAQRWNLRASPASPTGRQLGPGKRDELPPIVSEGVVADLAYLADANDWYGQQRFAEDTDADFLLRVISAGRARARSALSKATGEGG